MMNSIKNKLLALLALQLVICLAIFIQQSNKTQQGNMSTPLLPDSVLHSTFLKIEEGEKSLTLNKKDSKWQMEINGEPVSVDALKVDEFLKTLKDLKKTWPVGTTGSAASHFEVAEDKFKKRLTFGTEEDKQIVYIGTSPMFKKVNFRVEDDDNVYEVNLNANDAPVSSSEWMDKIAFAISDEITAVETNSMSLINVNNTWQYSLANTTALMPADKTEVDQFLAGWKNITPMGLVEDLTPFSNLKATNKVKINTKSKILTFTYYVHDNQHAIQIDDKKNMYLISESQAKELFEKSTDSFKAKETAPAENSTSTTNPAQATGANSVLMPSTTPNP